MRQLEVKEQRLDQTNKLKCYTAPAPNNTQTYKNPGNYG